MNLYRDLRRFSLFLAAMIAASGSRTLVEAAEAGGSSAQARSEALDAELAQELHRIAQYLAYEDQLLGMRVAEGRISSAAAGAALAQKASALYRDGFTDRDLTAKKEEHRLAAAAFFKAVQSKTGLAGPAASGSEPAALAPPLSKAASALGPTAPNPFTGSEERVIEAIGAAHGKFLADKIAKEGRPSAPPGTR